MVGVRIRVSRVRFRVKPHIHDTTCCQTNSRYNRFDNRLYRAYKYSTSYQTCLTTGLTHGRIVYTTGCQTHCTTRFDNRLNEQWCCSFNTVVKLGCTTGLTTVLKEQPLLNTVVKTVWQPAVSCKPGIQVSRSRVSRVMVRFSSVRASGPSE